MSKDTLQRFLLNDLNWRGEWLHLSHSLKTILSQHNYPAPVQKYLSEVILCNLLLTATLKFSGDLTVQFTRPGALRLLVSRCNDQLEFKSLARFDSEASDEALAQGMSEGTLVVSIQPKDQEMHQSIIPIQHNNIAETFEDYFDRSEQILTYLFLKIDGENAYGLLLQRLPQSLNPLPLERENIEKWFDETSFNDINLFDFLIKVFPEESIQLFDPKTASFVCGCNQSKIEEAVSFLSEDEIKAMLKEHGKITVACEFCNKEHHYVEH